MCIAELLVVKRRQNVVQVLSLSLHAVKLPAAGGGSWWNMESFWLNLFWLFATLFLVLAAWRPWVIVPVVPCDLLLNINLVVELLHLLVKIHFFVLLYLEQTLLNLTYSCDDSLYFLHLIVDISQVVVDNHSLLRHLLSKFCFDWVSIVANNFNHYLLIHFHFLKFSFKVFDNFDFVVIVQISEPIQKLHVSLSCLD